MKKKTPKWLKYAHSCYPNDEFFHQLDDQIRPMFEKLVGEKINWDKAWLSIEPIDDKYIFHIEIADAPLLEVYKTRELVKMKCRLGAVEGYIGWYNESGLETIYIDDEIRKRKLKFQLYDFEYKSNLFHTISLIKNRREKQLFLKIGDIEVIHDGIGHEGYLGLCFNKIPKADSIKSIGDMLIEARNTWNSEINKGLFHDIYFDKIDDENNKLVLFYYDNGSAQEEVFEYILNSLKGNDFGIKKIEFINL